MDNLRILKLAKTLECKCPGNAVGILATAYICQRDCVAELEAERDEARKVAEELREEAMVAAVILRAKPMPLNAIWDLSCRLKAAARPLPWATEATEGGA